MGYRRTRALSIFDPFLHEGRKSCDYNLRCFRYKLIRGLVMETFNNVQVWLDYIREEGTSDIIQVLVANKIDLVEDRYFWCL